MVGYVDSKGMSSREFFDRYQAGCTNFSGLDFSCEDFSSMVLDKPCSFTGCNMSDATFDHATLSGIDFSTSQMSRVNLGHANVQKCNFSGAMLPAKGQLWTRTRVDGGTVPLKQLQFSCTDAKAMGMVEGLKQAGYSCAEAKQAGLPTTYYLLPTTYYLLPTT